MYTGMSKINEEIKKKISSLENSSTIDIKELSLSIAKEINQDQTKVEFFAKIYANSSKNLTLIGDKILMGKRKPGRPRKAE